MFSILVSNTLIDLSPMKYKVIKAFTNFCIDELTIEQDFKLFLVDTSNDENIPEMSLACFMLENNDVFVRANGRIAMDINRSIAHELVHLQQKQENRIDLNSYTDIGGNTEDEANAVAGQLCKKFVNIFDCKWVYQF